jgi:hypothetical protein
MANPFYVEPVNILSVLEQGTKGYQFGQGLQRKSNRQAALASGDLSAAAKQLAAGGDLEGATQVSILNKNLAGPEQTDTLKNLAAENASRIARGLPELSPLQYQTNVAQAGASRNTVNMPPQEKAYDAAIGKELAELNVGIIKGAGTAQNKLNQLDRLGQLLQDPSVYQGAGGERVLQLKRLAKTAGIDVGDLGGAEAVQAISNQLALEARSPTGGAGMPGAMSDADREYLKAMQPGLERTPEGNRQIIEVNRRLNQRAVEVEKFRQNYVRKNKRLNEGFYSAMSEHFAARPLFGDLARTSQPQSNAPRQAPDGNFYVPDPQRPGKYLRVIQ